MDWELAIDRNRTALLTIVGALMASAGLRFGGGLPSLPRFLYAITMLAVRKAESATRRLIVIAAHVLALRGLKPRKARVSLTNFAMLPSPERTRVPIFNLIDPLKTFGREAPNFDAFDPMNACDFSATRNVPVCAVLLTARILALKCALESIPKQARRLARWYGKRDLALSQNQPHRLSPIRPGPSPSSRRRDRSEVGAVLAECHSLAIYARDRRDSS